MLFATQLNKTIKNAKLEKKKRKKNVNWSLSEEDLVGGLAVRNSIRVADINGAIGQDRAEEGANNSLSLVGASDIAIANVKDDQRMNLRRQAYRGRRWELQHCVLARHSLLAQWIWLDGRRECARETTRQVRALGFWWVSRERYCFHLICCYWAWWCKKLMARKHAFGFGCSIYTTDYTHFKLKLLIYHISFYLNNWSYEYTQHHLEKENRTG